MSPKDNPAQTWFEGWEKAIKGVCPKCNQPLGFPHHKDDRCLFPVNKSAKVTAKRGYEAVLEIMEKVESDRFID